ncbi:hypothetical protein BaRGS_00003298 [Batillaria attramentaria]|uniref:Uncharacterized protein n=1 Tax=Batillaria attramentaria TaxID=370345 RepID=A0ABD0M1L5_9CAEN
MNIHDHGYNIQSIALCVPAPAELAKLEVRKSAIKTLTASVSTTHPTTPNHHFIAKSRVYKCDT